MAEPRFTLLGKLVSIVLIAGLITLGGYMIMQRRASAPTQPTAEPPGTSAAPEVAEVQVEVPKLAPPAPVSRCPTFDFTVPNTQRCGLPVSSRHSVWRLSSSTPSPTGVPVAWHSMRSTSPGRQPAC